MALPGYELTGGKKTFMMLTFSSSMTIAIYLLTAIHARSCRLVVNSDPVTYLPVYTLIFQPTDFSSHQRRDGVMAITIDTKDSWC